MRPVPFPQANTVYAKDQPEYIPLPAYKGADGVVVSRWHLSWRERLSVLFGGGVFLGVWTFNGPLQPVRVGTSFEDAR